MEGGTDLTYTRASRVSSLRVRRKVSGCGSDCGDDGAGDETEVSREMAIKGSRNQAAQNLLI